MIAMRQIIEDPQDVLVIPLEFRHRRTEVIFMSVSYTHLTLPTICSV